MKQALPLLLAALLVGCAGSPHKKTASSSTTGVHMTVRTTAYTQTEAGGANNACDSRLHFGGNEYSAASDWSWLPLGTRFRMAETGRIYVIEDYGSALVGRKTIDLFQLSMAAVRSWGVRNVDIEILEWGSKVMSLKMLKPRATRGYIRTMVAELEKSVPPIAPAAASVSGAAPVAATRRAVPSPIALAPAST